jgi:glucose-1-phosphate thymidylyltransferase
VKRGCGAGVIGNRKIDPQGDIPVGLVLKKAVQAKLTVEGVMFPLGSYIDVGLPQQLVRAVKYHS